MMPSRVLFVGWLVLVVGASDLTCVKAAAPLEPSRLLNDVQAIQAELDSVEKHVDNWSLYINPELGNLLEGDIHVPVKNDQRRTFLKTTQRWPNGYVPFFLDDLISQNKHAHHILLNSMKTISHSTKNCIQFFPITKTHINTYPDLLYVNITGNELGCFSELGRSIEQTHLNLNMDTCFRLPGHSLHELVHTLGQTHEHMRPDRNDHISIVWKNVRKDALENFETMQTDEVTSFDLPYDYESITHYPRTAFSIDSTVATIIPKNASASIGQRTHLSKLDIQKLRLAYKCDEPKKPFKFEQLLKNYTDVLSENHTNPNEYSTMPPSSYPSYVAPPNIPKPAPTMPKAIPTEMNHLPWRRPHQTCNHYKPEPPMYVPSAVYPSSYYSIIVPVPDISAPSVYNTKEMSASDYLSYYRYPFTELLRSLSAENKYPAFSPNYGYKSPCSNSFLRRYLGFSSCSSHPNYIGHDT